MNRGDLSKPEAMLTNHSTALQGLFSRLAERAMAHNTIPGFYANMRMALRVRAQCRTTLEALAAIKNPPMVYARQANVTTGLSTTEGKARVSRNAYKGGTRALLCEVARRLRSL